MSRGFGNLNDEQLAFLIVESCTEDACDELFRRFRKKIYLWCFSYTHDRDESMELAQEIFIKIFANLGKFAGRASLTTWVYRITRNQCLTRLERERANWMKRLDDMEGIDVPDSGCLEKLRQAELKGSLEEILDAAGDRMKQEELQAFILHYREGLTVREITRSLGCENLTGARTLIQNARRKFQRLVEEEGYSIE
ncbi:MAG: RNA polymerase sigma factor [Candidatus Krumholzibacteria bacterium]|nr:RNA polymerase sigma factor [Candidatus Krumholzibacteria bacterium]